MHKKLSYLFAGLVLSLPALAEDQAASWQGNAALAFTRSGGNTTSTTYSAAIDEARTSKENKVSLYLSALYGESQGIKSADKSRAGSRFDHNLTDTTFGFGLLELEKDVIADLQLRTGGGAGFGYYFARNDVNSFDVFSGLTYSKADLISGTTNRGSEILLGEESNHKLSETTRLKQKLSCYPSAEQSGQYRTQFEGGLVVDVSSTMGLSISLQNKYLTSAAVGMKRSDTMLLTGLNIKL